MKGRACTYDMFAVHRERTEAYKPSDLLAALAECRKDCQVFLIASLVGLARNVAFTPALIENGTEIIACDKAR